MPISTLHSKTTGYIFNIQRYSVHDGQGIRTNVFLKGCPLRCHWCSNPESQNPLPELARNEGRCLGIEACGFCLRACPNEALALQGNDMPAIVRDKCISCMSCASLCPTGALTEKTMSGLARRWDIERVRTTCPFCGTGCNFDLAVKDGKVIGVLSTPEAPVNGQMLCVKGRFGWDFIYNEKRLSLDRLFFLNTLNNQTFIS